MNKLVWWGWWEISRYKQSSQLIFTKKNKFIRSIICQRSSSWKCVTHANASVNIFINWSLIGDIISSSMIGSISSNTPPAAQSLVWNIAMQKNTVWDGKNENPSGSWDIGLIFGLQNSFYFLKNMFASFPGAIRNGSKPMAAFFLGNYQLALNFWSIILVNYNFTTQKCCWSLPKYREPQGALQQSLSPPWLGPSPFYLQPFASPKIASTSEGAKNLCLDPQNGHMVCCYGQG